MEDMEYVIALAAQWAGPALIAAFPHLPPAEGGSRQSWSCQGKQWRPGDDLEPKGAWEGAGGGTVWPVTE